MQAWLHPMNTTREGRGGGRDERTDGRNSSIYGIFEGIPVPNYTDIVQCVNATPRPFHRARHKIEESSCESESAKRSWMNRFPIEKGSDSNYNVINLSRCSNYDAKFEISRNYPDNKGKRADRGLRGTWSKHASNWGTYPSQRCNRRYNQIPGIDTATQEWKLFK